MPVGWRRLANLDLEYTNYVNSFAQIHGNFTKVLSSLSDSFSGTIYIAEWKE